MENYVIDYSKKSKFVYVKDCFNAVPIYSATIILWKELSTNNYYISSDAYEIIDEIDKNQYMLLKDLMKPKPTKINPYRSSLTNAVKVTQTDFQNNFVNYGKSTYILRD